MNDKDKIPLLAVVGPTASGKTRLAVSLAKMFGGEVVSADSMQVYRRMDIATAKPDAAEQDGIPHHLIDFVEPDDAAFSVADYARLARKTIAEIAARGRIPVLTGGTGLYIDAVTKNIDYEGARSDPSLRAALEAEVLVRGNEAMLEELRAVDPEIAASLHANNVGRVLRALEVYRLTGVPMSDHQRRALETPELYKLCMLGINYTDRAVLYGRVNRRVDAMLAAGLLEEADEIAQFYGGTARQAIGYKELKPYLDGLLPLETCVDNLKQATRHYAKRQLTWFRKDERIQWLYADLFPSVDKLDLAAQNIVHKSGII